MLQTPFFSSGNWLDKLVQDENDAYRAFFGQTFDLSKFQERLKYFGKDRVDQWAKLRMEPHFLPEFRFQPDTNLPGWKVKPNDWFWEHVAAGNIKRRNAAGEVVEVKKVGFDGTVVLIDTRCKPQYDKGRQMFLKDDAFLGPVINCLRTAGEIARYEYGPQSSRFGISSIDWEEHIRSALQALPVFGGVSWRLELAIEANTIPQIYKQMPRREDGQTNTWVWYEEYFEVETRRLHGGNSALGGLANVNDYWVDLHWFYQAVRPLGVLDP